MDVLSFDVTACVGVLAHSLKCGHAVVREVCVCKDGEDGFMQGAGKGFGRIERPNGWLMTLLLQFMQGVDKVGALFGCNVVRPGPVLFRAGDVVYEPLKAHAVQLRDDAVNVVCCRNRSIVLRACRVPFFEHENRC